MSVKQENDISHLDTRKMSLAPAALAVGTGTVITEKTCRVSLLQYSMGFFCVSWDHERQRHGWVVLITNRRRGRINYQITMQSLCTESRRASEQPNTHSIRGPMHGAICDVDTLRKLD